jgi:hypothetical protein
MLRECRQESNLVRNVPATGTCRLAQKFGEWMSDYKLYTTVRGATVGRNREEKSEKVKK